MPLPPPTAPFPTAQTIMQAARALVNDAGASGSVAGNLLGDNQAFSLPLFNQAYRFAQTRLANAGVEIATKYATLINLLPVASSDPSVFPWMNWANYSDGVNLYSTPVLPPDLVMPLRLWQRLSGATASPFIPMRQANDGLPPIIQAAYFQCWEWRGNQLNFTGGLQSNDILMLYMNFLPDAQSLNDTIPIMRAENVMANLVAEYFCRSRGSAQADMFKAEADEAMRDLIRPTARQKQRGQHRRVPYGGGGGSGFGFDGFGSWL